MADVTLASAIQDSESLLRYASANGKTVPPDVISTLVRSKSLLAADDKDSATFPDQQAFWDALAKLTALTTPTTIDAMAASAMRPPSLHSRIWAWATRREPTRLSQGDRAVRQSGWFALVVLLLVGVLQLYADLGSSTIQDYGAAKLKYETNRRILQGARPEGQTDADAQLRAETNLLLAQTTQEIAALDLWMKFVPFASVPTTPLETPEHARHAQAQAGLVLLVLRGFLLPVGWGLLGAALYVCRTTADEIRSMSYSADNARLHLSRYFLGAVAGFVVAKFSVALSGKQIDDVVQPLVLALLVGYSVDVLFSMFDRLIAAFSSKQPAKATTEQ
jgi:hypothetical protein